MTSRTGHLASVSKSYTVEAATRTQRALRDMANTKVQHEVEEWVRTEFLPGVYGQAFSKRRLLLEPGGVFEFDAVSEDGRVAASISTASARTSSGKLASGTMNKIRADMLFFLMSGVDNPLLIFTEDDLLKYWEGQRSKGRVPTDIEFRLVDVPGELGKKLAQAKGAASKEMSK